MKKYKYIRTIINTIEKLIEEDNDCILCENIDELGYSHQHKMRKTWIKKQSDNLKDLCDECVIISTYAEKPKIMSFYEAEYFMNIYINKIESADPIIAIYGAVWHEWGLKYAIKLDEKGEWKSIC